MTFRRELRTILDVAVPVIIAELGWMFMGVVDAMMVGRLGPTALGAVSLGNAAFDVAAIFGIGLVLGLDTKVSQAFGAGRDEECDRWLWQGVYLAIFATPLLMLAVAASVPVMRLADVNKPVLHEAVPYLNPLNWSVLPLLLYSAVRRYLQGITRLKPVVFALVSANLVNVAGNYLLIGPFGLAGVGWSTCLSRIYMFAVLIGYTYLYKKEAFRRLSKPVADEIRELLRLGAPAAGQILLEVGVFATATTLAGRLNAESIAAHHVVLMIAGTTFMVPLGMSSAGAVLVGQAIGRGAPREAKRAGWHTIGLAAAFMSVMAVVLLAAPGPFLGAFTKNTEVLALATQLLFAAAIFQIFDGIQVTSTGVLRGAGNTRTPMFANLMAHWLVGLPTGYFLCFSLGFGVYGLWLGLSAGLIITALLLSFVWWRQHV